MAWSNWISLGFLVATVLVGVLSWLGSRNAAREARSAQTDATRAADRSALAAEDANRLQGRIVKLEELRQQESAFDVQHARLHAGITYRHSRNPRYEREDTYLTIWNDGQSTARKLEILINQKSIAEYLGFLTKPSPNASIGPRARLDLIIMFTFGNPLCLPFDVSLSWDDDSGVRGQWTSTVTG